jgi:hypothetical protein
MRDCGGGCGTVAGWQWIDTGSGWVTVAVDQWQWQLISGSVALVARLEDLGGGVGWTCGIAAVGVDQWQWIDTGSVAVAVAVD